MGHYWPKLRIKSNHTLSFITTPRTKDSNQKMRNRHRNPSFQVKTSDQFPSKETSDFINLKQLLSLICYFFFFQKWKRSYKEYLCCFFLKAAGFPSLSCLWVQKPRLWIFSSWRSWGREETQSRLPPSYAGTPFLFHPHQPHCCVSQPYKVCLRDSEGFPGGMLVKNPPASAGDRGDASSIPGSGRSPGGGHGNPLQYSCLGDPMDRGDWRAIVHRITENQTWLGYKSVHAQGTQNVRSRMRAISSHRHSEGKAGRWPSPGAEQGRGSRPQSGTHRSGSQWSSWITAPSSFHRDK